MDVSQVGSYVDKIKEFTLKNKVAVAAATAAVLVLGVGYQVYQSQPKSLVAAVQVEFTGYDGFGELSYDSKEISKEIQRIAYRSAGFNKNQTEDLVNQDAVVLSEVYADASLGQKYQKAAAMISSVSYKFDKRSELSNGDKVTLTVKTSSSKSPIKEESKEFKVEGLKKTETISTKALLEEYPVTFSGFNNYGKVELPEDEDGYDFFTVSGEKSNYKNGDKVQLTVSPSYVSNLQTEGKKLEATEIEVEVDGLKEISAISNLAEALAKNELYAKSQHQNTDFTTYTLEKQKDYISYQVPFFNKTEAGQVYVVSVYKINKATKYNNSVQYAYYGYRYYVNADNSLDLETANKVSGFSTQDYANLRARLETDGYKEYKVADKE
ncbi:hypothetical protein E5983_08350 [Streptococcus danieliae]|uniref:Uncharacterized protein n=1 Tax=Streptococcus danieliae TaxID=747656 RepID=A0A7X3KCJ4_9STRE|nr:hypothetical protein [Streptococcus danieliae]MVX59635.1 hypothetical protein [Streptococcus danieliae]